MEQIEALYNQHGPALLDYLRRQFASAGPAEDLLQETFVQALRRLDRLAEARSPKAWLFGVARYVALAAARRNRPMAELAHEPPAAAAPVDDRIELMRQAVARLPGPQREALELRLTYDLSYQEIAEALDIPIGTVRSRLHHAVESLRQTLSRKEI